MSVITVENLSKIHHRPSEAGALQGIARCSGKWGKAFHP